MILYCEKCLDKREDTNARAGMGFVAFCVPCEQIAGFCSPEELIEKYEAEIKRNQDLLKKAKGL